MNNKMQIVTGGIGGIGKSMVTALIADFQSNCLIAEEGGAHFESTQSFLRECDLPATLPRPLRETRK